MQNRTATKTDAIETVTHVVIRYWYPRFVSGGSGGVADEVEDIAISCAQAGGKGRSDVEVREMLWAPEGHPHEWPQMSA